MYIVHAPIIIFIAIFYSLILIPALIKSMIIFPIVLAMCFLINHVILRRISGLKEVLR